MSWDTQTEATAHLLIVYQGDMMNADIDLLRRFAERPGRQATPDEWRTLVRLVPSARRHYGDDGRLRRGEPGLGAADVAREIRAVRERMLKVLAAKYPEAAKRVARANRTVDISETGTRVIGVGGGEIDFTSALAGARRVLTDSGEPGPIDVMATPIGELVEYLRGADAEVRQHVVEVVREELGVVLEASVPTAEGVV